MARSGYTEYIYSLPSDGGAPFWFARFDWQISETDITKNTTTVYWWITLGGRDSRASCSAGKEDYTLVVNGQDLSGRGNCDFDANSSIVFKDGYSIISHNADGTGSFNYSFSIRLNNFMIATAIAGDGIAMPVNGTATLDKFDRSAHITGAADFTDEENPTITYSNPSGSNTTALDACISFDGSKDDVPYRSISTGGDTYTFELTEAERKTLRQGLTSGLERTVYFYVRSTVGGITYHTSIPATLSLINYEPTLAPTARDTNARTVELTGNNQKFIKYYSNASFTIGASAKKEATIVSQSASCGGQTIEAGSGTFERVNSNTIYYGITDSRGFTARGFTVHDIIPYIKLTSSLSLGLLTATGTVDFTIKGKYFEGSFGAKDNAMEVEYSVRDKDGNYVFNNGDEGSGWVKLGVVAPDVNDGNYTFTHTITGLDYKQTYTITVNVIDALTPVQTVSSVIAALPVFDWNGEDFHHHTDIVFSNDKRVMGMTADNEQIVALEPCDSEGDTTLGRGNYDSGEGDTRIYGNNIYLHPKEKIIINGKEYGAQRVLWSGVSHMNGGQSAALAQSISEQPNGAVLVFSLYRNGAAEDVSISSFFVSKYEVAALSNAPHFFFMGINAGFSTIGAKYLYIDDTVISGHEGNTQSGAASGITFNNSYFVLRYVIGV